MIKFIKVENYKCEECKCEEYQVIDLDKIIIVCKSCGNKFNGKYEVEIIK